MKVPFQLAIFLLLLGCANCVNWEAYGNFTDDNITIIRGYVQDHFPFSTPTATLIQWNDPTLANFAVNMSDYLNSLWDIAWNVVVVFSTNTPSQQYDAIFYGYGFRRHWMWINGYKTNQGQYFGIVIWKDYNCYKWYTFNQNADVSSHTFTGEISNQVYLCHTNFNTGVNKDIWETAHRLHDYCTTTQSALSGTDIAFSIVATEFLFDLFYGRFCAKGYRVNSGLADNGNFGKSIFIQMR